jgi:hypothetical protein
LPELSFQAEKIVSDLAFLNVWWTIKFGRSALALVKTAATATNFQEFFDIVGLPNPWGFVASIFDVQSFITFQHYLDTRNPMK